MEGTLHKFGKVIDGVRAVFFGVCDDEVFERATADGLPEGWFVFHVEASEYLDRPQSERVKEIRLLPLIRYECGNLASWRRELERDLRGRQIGELIETVYKAECVSL